MSLLTLVRSLALRALIRAHLQVLRARERQLQRAHANVRAGIDGALAFLDDTERRQRELACAIALRELDLRDAS